MWKCVSMRPPVRWINSAEASIWAVAIAWRVNVRPGRSQPSSAGGSMIRPPSSTAAQTCTCVALTEPIQVRGDNHDATPMPASHCRNSNAAKSRSVRAKMLSWCSRQSVAAREFGVLHHQHAGLESRPGGGEDIAELLNGRAGARALGVQDEHQRVFAGPRCVDEAGLLGPLRGGRAGWCGREAFAVKQPEPDANKAQPGHDRPGQDYGSET